MLSPENLALVTGAVDRVVQQRASAADAVRNAALRPASTPAAPAAKKPVKAKATTAKTAKTAAGAPASPAITPYLTSTDLMGLNDQQAAAEGKISAAQAALTGTAAQALNSSGNIERSRVKNVSDANNDAAARGIYNSGIRLGNTGMANSAAARGQEQLVRGVGLATQNASSQVAGAKNALGGYLQALVSKAAENGQSLPVDPYSMGSQNGAANVKGAATMKSAIKGSK